MKKVFFCGKIIKKKRIERLKELEKEKKIREDERKKQILNRMLKKVVLTFDGNIILVSKSNKWDNFSHLQRLPFKVPSSTNSLESFHGHLNSHVARRNNFFHAIFKLANTMLMTTQNI